MRALGVTRLVRDTEESTSVERQTEQIRATAAPRGHALVHVSVDTDVSGSGTISGQLASTALRMTALG